MCIWAAGVSGVSIICRPSGSTTPYVSPDHVSLLGPLLGLSWNTIYKFGGSFLLSLGSIATSVYLI